MSVYYDEINIRTKGEVDIVDITDDLQSVVNKSKLKDGIVCVFVPGSTGTITTIGSSASPLRARSWGPGGATARAMGSSAIPSA